MLYLCLFVTRKVYLSQHHQNEFPDSLVDTYCDVEIAFKLRNFNHLCCKY